MQQTLINVVHLENKNLDDENIGGALWLNNLDTDYFEYFHIPSGSNVEVELGDNYSVGTLDENIDDYYTHINWNNDFNRIKRVDTGFQMNEEKIDEGLIAYYDYQEIVNISSNFDQVQLSIQDPWWGFPAGELPPEEDWIAYQPGNEWVEISENSYRVFNNINQYFDDGPIYSIKADPPIYYSYDSIYEFVRWEGIDVIFSNDSSTTNPETPVVFTSPDAEVVAIYENIFQGEEYVVIDELTIPTGMNITVSDGFKLKVNNGGNLNIEGTAENPVILTAENSWEGITVYYGSINIKHTEISNSITGLEIESYQAYNFNTEEVFKFNISNVTVTNSENGILLNINQFGPQNIPESWNPFTIENCVFQNIQNYGIKWITNFDMQSGLLEINNCLFYNLNNAIEIDGEESGNDFEGSVTIYSNEFREISTAVEIKAQIEDYNYWYPQICIDNYGVENCDWEEVYNTNQTLEFKISYNLFENFTTGIDMTSDLLLLSHHNLFNGNQIENTTAFKLNAYSTPPTIEPCHLHSHLIGNETIVNCELGIMANFENTNMLSLPNCYTIIVENTILYNVYDFYDSYGGSFVVLDDEHNFVSGNPFFVDPENNDYHLTQNSPVIDEGMESWDYNLDGEYDQDPDGTRLDMGAFYFNYLIGDVNSDGEINILDIPVFVNYILGNPNYNFQFHVFDLNQDGIINITDVLALINIILGNDSLVNYSTITYLSGIIEAMEDGQRYKYNIDMLNEQDVYILHFKLQFENKIPLNIMKGLRSNDMTVSHVYKEDDYSLNIMVFSPEGRKITPGFGTIVEIELESTGLGRDGDLTDGSEFIITDLANNPETLIPVEIVSADELSRLADEKLNKLIPTKFALYPVYPNPFNPTATIRYDLPQESQVSLMVYDLNGRLIETLINSNQYVGINSVNWNAEHLPSGAYFIKLFTGEFEQIQKVILLK